MTQAVIATTVTGLQGRPVVTTAPTANQALTWNGSAWAPAGPFIPMIGGTVTGPLNFNYSGPFNTFTDTNVANTAGGLWRTYVNGGVFYIQCNTAAAGNFSTAAEAFYADHNGNATIGGSLNVGGGATVGGALSANSITAAGNVTGGNLVGSTSGATYPNGTTNSIIVSTPGAGWSWSDGTRTWFYICQGSVDPVFLWQHGGVGTIMSLNSVGNVVLAGTLSQGSDETLKTNINPLTQGISLIRQLIPKSYAWKATPQDINWGFVAQDVQPVIPVAVGETVPVEGGVTTLTLDFNAILAALTYAMKQVDERLCALELHDGIVPPAAQLA